MTQLPALETAPPPAAPPRPPFPLLWLGIRVGAVLALVLVLLAGAEVLMRVLVRPRLANDPHLQLSAPPPFFVHSHKHLEPMVVAAHPDKELEPCPPFPVAKPPGTFRIFCLGGGASAGWPHARNERYSEYLRQALQAAYPERSIEMLNVGVRGQPSYGMRLLAQEALELAPDLLIVWCGHDEFRQARRYRGHAFHRFVSGLVRKSQFLQFLVERTTGLTIVPEEPPAGLALRADPEQYELVQDHFRYSLAVILHQAGVRRVPVLLFTAPANLRDWRPEISHRTLADAARAAWDQEFAAGRRALQEGDLARAVTLLADALEREPGHALAHFELARAYDRLGDPERAYGHYQRAKDEDLGAVRAPSRLNETVRVVGRDNWFTLVVDLEAELRSAAARGVPGFDLFADAVHPSQQGHELIARLAFTAILGHRGLGLPPPKTQFTLDPRPVPYVAALDLGLHLNLLGSFGGHAQPEAYLAELTHVESLLPGGLGSLPTAARALFEQGRSECRAFVDAEQKTLRGEPAGRDHEAAHQAFAKEFAQRFARVKSELAAAGSMRH